MSQQRWLSVTKTNRQAIGVAANHYSTQKPYSRELGPPGQKLIFLTLDGSALWGSHRPAPWAGIDRMDGFKGHSCFIFRNTGAFLSSELIREAVGLTAQAWGLDPFLTYVAVDKVQSANPGYCYKVAGFRHVKFVQSQKHGKVARLEMDIDGVRECWTELL